MEDCFVHRLGCECAIGERGERERGERWKVTDKEMSEWKREKKMEGGGEGGGGGSGRREY